MAAERIIEQFDDGLVIAKAQPLQHHESYSKQKEMRYESFEARPAIAMKQLEEHWRRLGFERIAKTEYLGLSTERRRTKPKWRLSGKSSARKRT